MWATVPGMSNEELAQLTGVETVVTEAVSPERNVFLPARRWKSTVSEEVTRVREARRLSPAMPLPKFHAAWCRDSSLKGLKPCWKNM